MGLRDKYKKTNENNHFKPLDLNEMNVQAIFKRCLITDSTDEKNIIHSILYGESTGFSKLGKQISFDKQKLFEDTDTIKFLYGQLQSSHNNITRIPIKNSNKKYDGQNWTTNDGVIMELFHLGHAINIISPFYILNNNVLANSMKFEPTLSPKDPKFAEWYKGYEAKMKKAEGPEPDEK